MIKTTFLTILLSFLLAAGCGQQAEPQIETPPSESHPSSPSLTLRIVEGAESGDLLLAGEQSSEVYLLSANDIPITLDGKAASASDLEDGMPITVFYDGSVEETWPAQLGSVSAISTYSIGTPQNPAGGYYDLCGLYLQVLEDLWEKDSALNNDAAYISVDLSRAPGTLTEGEKAAIAFLFAMRHDAEPLTLSYEELIQQDFLSGDAPYYWKDGVLFSITPASEGANDVYSLPVLTFTAQKWRSGLGAYGFGDCKAGWPECGTWSSYTIGAEFIS